MPLQGQSQGLLSIVNLLQHMIWHSISCLHVLAGAMFKSCHVILQQN